MTDTGSDRVTASVPPATVYVVDDDPELCESVEWLLDSIGIQPVVCHSATDFLDVYRGDHPACIVLDVRMPQMSGPRLQETLNSIAPHVVVVFVSAHGDIRMSVSTLQAGAMDFLEKPYDPQRLLDVVQAGVGRARSRFATHLQKKSIEAKVATLTPREREILGLVVEGLPSQNIARMLSMSVKTVDVHRARIKSKTDADSVTTLVRDILRYDVTIPG
ncbi:response regulator transcription factor [Rhodococcoides corynebacterioides]|uniref:response regulator transcription factor n=1 Tax=Rhodococcoides corynebacterioides TaxID=53972 RepID=UPI003F7FAFE1